MSHEKIFFYIITIIWAYIIAIAGPIFLLGQVNPDGTGAAEYELFFSLYFFLSTFFLTARSGIELFIINMFSTLLLGIAMSWIITKIAVKKEYREASRNSLRQGH